MPIVREEKRMPSILANQFIDRGINGSKPYEELNFNVNGYNKKEKDPASESL